MGDRAQPATKGAAKRNKTSSELPAKDGTELRERLRRSLFLIPYAVAHPGCTVEELAAAARLTPEELIVELDFLRMVGRPPFSPADLVDLDVVDGRVEVTLAQGLSRPPTLTPLEAAALDAAASALAAEGGSALARARERLRAAVPPPARAQFDAVAGRVLVAAGSLDPAQAALLDRAIEQRRELELTYWTAARGVASRRTLRPLERVLHQGYWYLHAYCCARRDRRLFRLDRISDVVVTERPFAARPSDAAARFQRESLYAPSAQATRVRVRLQKGPWAEPAVARRLGATEFVRTDDGGAETIFPVEGEGYVVSVVLSLAAEAELLDPPALRARVREAALAVAERHRDHEG